MRSRRVLAGLFAALLAVGVPVSGSPQPATPGPAPSPGFSRLRLVRVFDEEGFGQPVEAYRFLAPSDWQVQAWTRWRQESVGCPSNIVEAGAVLSAPDRVTGVEVFPTYGWQWVDEPQSRQLLIDRARQMNQVGIQSCPWQPQVRAADFLRDVVIARRRPGAQIVDMRPEPGVARALDAMWRPYVMPALQSGYLLSYTVDAARLRLAYVLAGRPVDEWVTGALAVGVQRTPTTLVAAHTFDVSPLPLHVTAIRAPRGELERRAPFLAAIVGSIRANPTWLAAVWNVQLAMGKTQLAGAQDRARIMYETQQSIGQIYTRVWAAQQQTYGQLAQQYSETVRGVETFHDRRASPGLERVEVPGGYREAWSNGRGEYILSNDPNFNPAVTFRENWERMPVVGRQ